MASDVAALASLPEGTDARPFALFSVTQGRAMCGEYKCGHTGIVVSVNGDEITTVEAAWGVDGGAYVAHYDISYFINTQHGNTFTYLDSILNQSDLAQIVGN